MIDKKTDLAPIEPTNFIEEFINQDILEGKVSDHIHTRFPPEPNGYLHIGHCKAIYIDFMTAKKYGGLCNLRYDDTNPSKEEEEFVEVIEEDIKWLGFEWNGGLFHGSDYFDETYAYAEKLILSGDAYIDELSADEMREYRGTLTSPGKNSPYRDRDAQESLKLFREMREGKFADGEITLRSKIDMSSPNINLRDPVIYRIKHATHHRTGDKWCIYPMYDFAHPIQDALEGITHSLCSLEYEAHRPLYDWVVEKCEFEHKPRQIEFARLNITDTVMSKRYLRMLVEENVVSGWDDPRMPTLRGLKRKGYSANAIKDFIGRAGIAKADSVVDFKLLEHCVREDLNDTARRAMVVLDPLKVVITDWEEDEKAVFTRPNHPKVPELGTHEVKFGKELYIEREDFMEVPVRKYRRLKPEGEVRLMGGYIIKCEEIIKDAEGNVIQLNCSHDKGSYTGGPTSDRKIKGTIHWVEKNSAVPLEVRHYDTLLDSEKTEGEYIDRLNENSLEVLENSLAERWIGEASKGDVFQFMRKGYYVIDSDTTEDRMVVNRTVSLRDSWSRNMGKK